MLLQHILTPGGCPLKRVKATNCCFAELEREGCSGKVFGFGCVLLALKLLSPTVHQRLVSLSICFLTSAF